MEDHIQSGMMIRMVEMCMCLLMGSLLLTKTSKCSTNSVIGSYSYMYSSMVSGIPGSDCIYNTK